jgi:hypothetical protein
LASPAWGADAAHDTTLAYTLTAGSFLAGYIDDLGTVLPDRPFVIVYGHALLATLP